MYKKGERVLYENAIINVVSSIKVYPFRFHLTLDTQLISHRILYCVIDYLCIGKKIAQDDIYPSF